jgi:hypothetical protein
MPGGWKAAAAEQSAYNAISDLPKMSDMWLMGAMRNSSKSVESAAADIQLGASAVRSCWSFAVRAMMPGMMNSR